MYECVLKMIQKEDSPIRNSGMKLNKENQIIHIKQVRMNAVQSRILSLPQNQSTHLHTLSWSQQLEMKIQDLKQELQTK